MEIGIIEFPMEQIGEIHHGNPNNKYFHGFRGGISFRALPAPRTFQILIVSTLRPRMF